MGPKATVVYMKQNNMLRILHKIINKGIVLTLYSIIRQICSRTCLTSSAQHIAFWQHRHIILQTVLQESTLHCL